MLYMLLTAVIFIVVSQIPIFLRFRAKKRFEIRLVQNGNCLQEDSPDIGSIIQYDASGKKLS